MYTACIHIHIMVFACISLGSCDFCLWKVPWNFFFCSCFACLANYDRVNEKNLNLFTIIYKIEIWWETRCHMTDVRKAIPCVITSYKKLCLVWRKNYTDLWEMIPFWAVNTEAEEENCPRTCLFCLYYHRILYGYGFILVKLSEWTVEHCDGSVCRRERASLIWGSLLHHQIVYRWNGALGGVLIIHTQWYI